jgi:iron complex outermembrane receptor protein
VKKLVFLCSTAVLLPTVAFAQSTGTQEFEEKIVVTGTRSQEVGGVQAPDSTKAKAVLTQEYIARQIPGQTVLDTINAVPGVSFQNNDAYGSSGGTLTIRGFTSDRVSVTFDGIQLNDSGNYAIFSGQTLDPELIDQVNVNLGTTDVDSPTASAVGGTVNIRTRLPYSKFGGRVVGSLGEYDFRRIFAVIDTGEIGPWRTRSYFTVSNAKNDNPFNNYGKVDKQQYNGKIYQPIGNNGDFVELAGHYNRNRNNFFGSVNLRHDVALPPGGFPQNRDDREYDILYPCTVDVAVNGVADAPNNCGSEFDRRYNPSDTGNVRLRSRFTLTDKLVLNVEPSIQFVKANGGGVVTARETCALIGGVPYAGYILTSATSTTGTPNFCGVDLNFDGDALDQVRILAPSQTRTFRPGLFTNLRYAINDDHIVRLSYTLDHARHRQTGETGLLDETGEPFDVSPIDDPLVGGTGGPSTTSGVILQKRDRKSYAILHQVAGEWRGEFFADTLTLNVGVRLPFFTRKLDQRCFVVNAAGGVTCFNGDTDAAAAFAAANPYVVDPVTNRVTSGFAPPDKRTFKYDDILPNIGFIYDITPRISAFGNYAKGLSVPSTDNLYNSFFFPDDAEEAQPKSETTDSGDLGLRYRSSKIQAQVGLWKTKFKNRSASAFDPELNATVFRNLGEVDKWGFDGTAAYSPVRQLTLYAFGSWNKSKIKDNIQVGSFGGITDCDNIPDGATQQNIIRSCSFTAGKSEAGSPKYTYGFSALGTLGPVELGVTAKRTGPRYVFDNNEPLFSGDIGITTPTPGRVVQQKIFGATAPAYWLVNLDARFNLNKLVGLEKSYFQLNVYNLFDKVYVGGFTAGLAQSLSTRTCNASSTPSCVPTVTVPTWGFTPFAQIGAPRTISGSLSIEW